MKVKYQYTDSRTRLSFRVSVNDVDTMNDEIYPPCPSMLRIMRNAQGQAISGPLISELGEFLIERDDDNMPFSVIYVYKSRRNGNTYKCRFDNVKWIQYVPDPDGVLCMIDSSDYHAPQSVFVNELISFNVIQMR